MNILVVNDDGIEAEGLRILVKALSYQGRIFVASPKNNQSATSHKITVANQIEVEEREGFLGSSGTIIVDGTPADCVRLGLKLFSNVDFDLVVSGINHGANLAIDTHYSGTVAAAREARILGVPSIAISASDINADFIYDETIKLIDELMENDLVSFDGFLNINYPKTRPIGRVTTVLGNRSFHAEYVKSTSNKNLYHIVYSVLDSRGSLNTDSYACDNGYVSITPLLVDSTNTKAYKKLRDVFGEIK